MREIIDIFMLVAFVLFMIFLVRGFMLQSQQRQRDKLDK
jgi:flagellar biogenesis protein FliO